MIVLSIIHAIKIYYDLLDENRKSLDHLVERNKKLPKITIEYKLITIAILVNSFLFTITAIFTTISLYLKSSSIQCKYILQTSNILYQLSKMVMYLVFTFRLHTVYGHTIYAYNKIFSSIMAAFIIIYHIFLIIILALDISNINITKQHCYINIFDLTSWISWLIIITDIVILISFLSLFLRPLRTMISYFEISDEAAANEYNKILRTLLPTKYLIIISGATYIIFVMYLWDIIIPDYYNLIIPIGSLICFICIGLMSLYYSDFVYFQNLCRLCIICCSCIISVKPNTTTKSNVSDIETVDKRKSSLKLTRNQSGKSQQQSIYDTRVETVKKEHSMIEQSEMTKTNLAINEQSELITKAASLTANSSMKK